MIHDAKRKEIAVELIDSVLVSKGLQRFIYQGSSMCPILIQADILLVKVMPSGNIRFGDIMVYKEKDRFIVHRFICRKKIGGVIKIIAKADNRFRRDRPINVESVIGKVVQVSRNKNTINMERGLLSCKAFIIAVVSFTEALVFENVFEPTVTILRKIRARLSLKRRLMRILRLPKALLLKILCRI